MATIQNRGGPASPQAIGGIRLRRDASRPCRSSGNHTSRPRIALIVADASVVTQAVGGTGEQSLEAIRRITREASLAPQMLDLEVASALRGLAHRGTLTESAAHTALRHLDIKPNRPCSPTEWPPSTPQPAPADSPIQTGSRSGEATFSANPSNWSSGM